MINWLSCNNWLPTSQSQLTAFVPSDDRRGVPVTGGNAKAAAAHGEHKPRHASRCSSLDIPVFHLLVNPFPAVLHELPFFALSVAVSFYVSFYFPFFFFFHAWLNLSHLADWFGDLFPHWHSVKALHSVPLSGLQTQLLRIFFDIHDGIMVKLTGKHANLGVPCKINSISAGSSTLIYSHAAWLCRFPNEFSSVQRCTKQPR